MLRGFGHTLFYLLELGVLLSGGIALAVQPSAWLAILICVTGASVTSLFCERYARRYLRSTLGALRRVADDVGRGRPTPPLEAHPGDDFYKLASAINLVAARLEESARQQCQLHDELQRRERLAFLGELAATVAHEINNPLDGVQNCLRILRRSGDDPVRAAQMRDLMESGLSRMEMIVRRLLTLARENVIKPTPTRISEIVERALAALAPKFESARVRVEREFAAADAAPVDAQLLEQVFVNLMHNALDSMPDGGDLRIAIQREELPRAPLGAPPMSAGPPAARVLCISVRDTGAGIAPELLPHIFEPFMTTKRDGKGTGLGLAIAARIVDAHRGALTVEPNADGVGTTFLVRIPLASGVDGIRTATASATS